jgi:DNA polymerase-3 subunit delta
MVAIKASGVERFLRSPDPALKAVLVYGPDSGLVSERALRMQQHFARGDDAELVRLDDRDLAESEGRLEVEINTMPMFAGSKVVRVTAGARLDAASLKAALDAPPEAALIVEAGNLKPDSALRKLFEKLPFAAALPCFAEERNVLALIEEELKAAGLRADRETFAYLMSRLGADQALSRAEVAKLIVYAGGKGAITIEDVDAVVGDSAEVAVENFVYLVSGGETAEAIRQLGRLVAAGTPAQMALVALGRHFSRLHLVAASDEATDAAMRKLKPPLHFKRRDAFADHVRRWGAKRLLEVLPRIQEATLRARLSDALEQAHAERLVLALAQRRA